MTASIDANTIIAGIRQELSRNNAGEIEIANALSKLNFLENDLNWLMEDIGSRIAAAPAEVEADFKKRINALFVLLDMKPCEDVRESIVLLHSTILGLLPRAIPPGYSVRFYACHDTDSGDYNEFDTLDEAAKCVRDTAEQESEGDDSDIRLSIVLQKDA